MKVIWFIVSVLVLTAVFTAFRSGNSSQSQFAMSDSPAPPPATFAQPAPVRPAEPSTPATREDTASLQSDTDDTDVDSEPAADDDADAQASDGGASAANGDDATDPADGLNDAAHVVDNDNDGGDDDAVVIADADVDGDADAAAAAAPGAAVAQGDAKEERTLPPGLTIDPNATVSPFDLYDADELAEFEKLAQLPVSRGKFDENAEGGIPGSGTKEDPYRITWDLLIMASHTYRPREDMREIPELLQMVADKHVRISGYMLVPLGSIEFDEALMMMNMWDGCCIGLPPTAYDAIEISLERATAYRTQRAIAFGTIEGILKVDPYEVSGWLVGLYLIEDAVVTELM